MKSTAVNGTVSRVVPSLDPGQAVTTSRFDVSYIVTEYGIAFLRGKNIRQRAEALIAVAAPQFRDQLREEFRALYGYV
jgi:4-hydroxybutyrate CoA-transferase